MRIDLSIPSPRDAAAAPDRSRALAAAAFVPVFAPAAVPAPGVGPEGMADRAARRLNDPLGLAAEQAMTSPAAEGPKPGTAEEVRAAPEPMPTTDQRTEAAPRGHQRASSSDPAGAAEIEHEQPRRERAEPGVGSRTTPNPSADDQAAARAPAAGAATPASGGERVAARGVSALSPAVGGVQAASAGGGGGAAAGSAGQTPSGLATLEATAAVGRARLGESGQTNKGDAARPDSFGQVLRGERAEVAPQLAKGLASLLMRDGGSVQIQLRPEALGRVRVDLAMSDGVVSARLSAESEAARGLLNEEIDSLRAMLERRGLRVERLEVSGPMDNAERETPAFDRQSPGDGGSAGRDGTGAFGRDAESGTPWNGGRDGRWGGDPRGRAERGDGNGAEIAAESGDPVTTDGMDAAARRSGDAVSIRLDAVA